MRQRTYGDTESCSALGIATLVPGVVNLCDYAPSAPRSACSCSPS